MRQAELTQLEMISHIDRLIDRCDEWPGDSSAWEPAQRARHFLQSVLPRVRTVRERLQLPLVVAMFGGTGTGKSSLVNALLGQEVVTAGRQRPTTTRPQILVHPDINFDLLQLPTEDCDIHRTSAPLLEDLVIVDCPDPDTSENDDATSNLERLRRFLPHSDVLIYTSTQQKYRSANVQDELREAAAGCKLVFVQTHADRDVDIRDDWKKHLTGAYEIPDLFFVDSVKGLQEQLNGQPVSGELGRLQNFLLHQLTSSNRGRIRRDNVLDLLYATLSRATALLHEFQPALQKLEAELAKNSRGIQEQMSRQLQEDLLGARQLWERRLVDAVVRRWGSSPFSWLLRLNHSLGTLLGSFGLMRARTTAHIALLGLTQGARMWKQHQQEQDFSSMVSDLNDLAVSETEIEEKRLVLNGFARQAGFETRKLQTEVGEQKRPVGSEFQAEFLSDAQAEVDEAVERLGKKNSKSHVKLMYDLLFLIYPGFLLWRIGKNFFWDSFVFEEPILAADFYIPAGVFLLLWCGLFIMFFTRRLRRGLKKEVRDLVTRLIDRRLHHDMFPVLQRECQQAQAHSIELAELEEECSALRAEQPQTMSLGAPRPAEVEAG